MFPWHTNKYMKVLKVIKVIPYHIFIYSKGLNQKNKLYISDNLWLFLSFTAALKRVLLNTDIATAINIHIPNNEKTFLKSNISNIFCHQTVLSILKLSNHLENTPNITPNNSIKIVLIILFFKFS